MIAGNDRDKKRRNWIRVVDVAY